MSLNIKNEEIHRLVRQLAELTGQSQTSAVEDAVRRRLAELTADQAAERRRAKIAEIVQRAQEAAATDPEWLNTDWDAELYDGRTGLPR
jgi:antitoxin VapB